MRGFLLLGSILAVLVGWLFYAAPAHADGVFQVCPSGRVGVAGGHTSCSFAEIVRAGYYHDGNAFLAYSPVTGQVYTVRCVPGYIASFSDGTSRVSVHCFAGDNARVVVW